MKKNLWMVVFVGALVRLAVFIPAHNLDHSIAAAFKLADVARHYSEGHGFVYDQRYLDQLNKVSVESDPVHPRLELLEDVPPPPYDSTQVQSFRGRPPGYSVVLASTWKIFGHKKFIYSQIFFCALDLLACVFVFLLGRAVFGEKVALMAGLLYAINISSATMSTFPIHDAIGSSLLAAATYLIFSSENPNRAKWILAGVLLGASSLIRQEAYLVPVVFMIAFAMKKQWRNVALSFLLVQLVVVLMSAPWSARNKQQFGQSTTFSPAYAANLFAGLGEEGNPWGIVQSDPWVVQYVTDRIGRQPLHSTEFNGILMQAFLEAVKQHPLAYVKIVIKRTIKFLMPTLMPFEKSYSRYYKQVEGKTGVIGYIAEYPFLFLMAILSKVYWIVLWGLSLVALKENKAVSWALLGLALYYLLAHVPMHTESRFILPGYFGLTILGAQGAQTLFQRYSRRPA